MPVEQLRELQLDRMKRSFAHAYENIPLYRERFAEAGVVPSDLKSLDDLVKFPFLTKQDMRDSYPFGLFAVPQGDVARIHASSGTTGQATVVGHTANDLKNWGECFARGIYMVGGSRDSVIQVSYGYGLFTGGLGAHAGGEAVGCSVIPTSSGNTKRQIQMMKDLGTDILACTPSYALLIADTAIEMGYDPAKDFKVSGVILGAEPASEGMRDEIRQKLGVQYCDVYGLSEVMGPGVAMECSASHGLHVAEDHFYPEIVDPDTLKPVPDGTYGELVFTTLTRECCPLVRYRTRDVTRIINEECSCRTHAPQDRPHHRSHRRHDDHPRRQRVPVPDRAGHHRVPGDRHAVPDRAVEQRPARPHRAAGGARLGLPVRRDPQARGPQAPTPCRAQEQPADLG